MKSIIEIEYLKTPDGRYLGWAPDYTAVAVHCDTLEELEGDILKSLKVLFMHFVDKIDDGTIGTNIEEVNINEITD